MSKREENGRRFRNARKDANVASVEANIEKVFGLPEGSVQINRANGKNARGDKKVGNLKNEYGND